MRIAVLIDNIGPYHLARLKAAAGMGELLAVEFGAGSNVYTWDRAADPGGIRRACVNPDGTAAHLPRREFRRRLFDILDASQPQVVFLPGWSKLGAFLAMDWCGRRKVPAVVMSDSTAWDERRKPWLERVKQIYLQGASAAFVAGTPHEEYLRSLGFSGGILSGYDVVDNDHFARESLRARERAAESAEASGLPARYFLASARFVRKKNLSTLIGAFGEYRKAAGPEAWDLVLLGDGELRPELEQLILRSGLHGKVVLPGFRQYHELPAYFGRAAGFIHASTSEQWGLVVNEAMAVGLPVIVSSRCGCARDLVAEGVNGWTFDPTRGEELVKAMLALSSLGSAERDTMAEAGRKIIAGWSPELHAENLWKTAKLAAARPWKNPGLAHRLILKLLIRRG